MRRFATLFFVLLAIYLGLFYYYRAGDLNWIIRAVANLKNIILPSKPCVEPIEFSIGVFDNRFGLSEASFVSYVKQAADVWNEASNTVLFEYSPTGPLKIDLVYDSRQMVTNELKQQDVVINNDKSTYDTLKFQYDNLVSTYESKKAIYENKLSNFESRQVTYNEQIKYWNNRGGAPLNEYNDLEKQKAALNSEMQALYRDKQYLDDLIDQINTLIPKLNSLGQKLNMKVAIFNKISGSNGEEFSEGEYIQDSSGSYIRIYQFDDKAQFVRLLEHELGHALGLDHVDDSKAIMYYLNKGSSTELTKADIMELNRVCGW